MGLSGTSLLNLASNLIDLLGGVNGSQPTSKIPEDTPSYQIGKDPNFPNFAAEPRYAILGTNQNNTITGIENSGQQRWIRGEGGNDTIGYDAVSGKPTGNAGSTFVNAGEGDDNITATGNRTEKNVLFGGQGDDLITFTGSGNQGTAAEPNLRFGEVLGNNQATLNGNDNSARVGIGEGDNYFELNGEGGSYDPATGNNIEFRNYSPNAANGKGGESDDPKQLGTFRASLNGDENTFRGNTGKSSDYISTIGNRNSFDLELGRGTNSTFVSGDENKGSITGGRDTDTISVDGDKNGTKDAPLKVLTGAGKDNQVGVAFGSENNTSVTTGADGNSKVTVGNTGEDNDTTVNADDDSEDVIVVGNDGNGNLTTINVGEGDTVQLAEGYERESVDGNQVIYTSDNDNRVTVNSPPSEAAKGKGPESHVEAKRVSSDDVQAPTPKQPEAQPVKSKSGDSPAPGPAPSPGGSGKPGNSPDPSPAPSGRDGRPDGGSGGSPAPAPSGGKPPTGSPAPDRPPTSGGPGGSGQRPN